MASRISELLVKITGNADGFRGAMAQVNRDLKVSLDRAENTSRGFTKFGQTLSSVGQSLALGFSVPVLGFGAAAVKVAGDLEALKLGLAAVTGSSAEAEKQFTELREVAKLPGLGLEEAVRGSTNLQAIGFSAAKSKEILLQFGNALASVGRGREDLEEVIRQLGQMASRGKVTSDNLKPILERVPQAAAVIRKEFGTIDTEVLQKMGISAERLTNTLLTEFGKLPRVAGGLKNDFENLRDSIKIALSEAGKALAPFAKAFVDDLAVPTINKIGDLGKAFGGLSPEVKNFTVTFGGIAVATPVFIAAAGTIISNLTQMKTAMAAAGVQTGLLGLALKSAGWIAVAAEMVVLTESIFDLGDAQNSLRRAGEDGEKAARRLADSLGKRGIVEAQEALAKYEAALKNLRTSTGGRVTFQPKAEADELNKLEIVLRSLAVAHRPLKVVLTEAEQAAKNLADGAKLTAGQVKHLKTEQEALGEEFLRTIGYSARLAGAITDLSGYFEKMGVSSKRAVLELDIPSIAQATREYEALNTALSDLQNTARGGAGIALLTPDLLSAHQNAERARKGMEDVAAGTQVAMATVRQESRQVSLIVNDLAESLTDLAFKGGKLKERLAEALDSIGKALLRSAIETQLGRIAKLVTGLLAQIPGLGKVLGAVFGGGASAAGAAGGGIGGGAGGAAGGAASGLTGAITAGASVATAVSGVISNFQFAHMNTALGRIEESTRRVSILTENDLVSRGVNLFLSQLPQIHDRLRTIIDRGIGVYNAPGYELRFAGAAGGGGGLTIGAVHFHGADADRIASDLVTFLKDRGVFPGG